MQNTKNEMLKNYRHVFIISSPIVEVVAFQYVIANNISEESIVIIPYRGYSPTLLKGHIVPLRKSVLDRISMRLFMINLPGVRMKSIIEKYHSPFLLYAAWDFPETVEILNSNLCGGHAYLEEGQMSHNPSRLYSFQKNRRAQKQRLMRWRESIKKLSYKTNVSTFLEFYNDSAFAFVGVVDGAFSACHAKNIVILNQFSAIKETYKPHLMGVNNIGIMCSPRRLYPDRFDEALARLSNTLPAGSTIKLHPDFKAFPGLRERMVLLLKQLRNDEVSICDDHIIMELEMFHEPKRLVGSISSLQIYAKAFGSTFESVALY